MPANRFARIGTELWGQKLQQDPEFDLYRALLDSVTKANSDDYANARCTRGSDAVYNR
jgi:hypothetical protein